MPDLRSRREKLEAMAAQTAIPNEAAIARRLLAEMPADTAPEPARRQWEAAADDFVSRMTVQYTSTGIKVSYAGGVEPGVIGSMLREAMRGERAPKVAEGPKELPDA